MGSRQRHHTSSDDIEPKGISMWRCIHDQAFPFNSVIPCTGVIYRGNSPAGGFWSGTCKLRCKATTLRKGGCVSESAPTDPLWAGCRQEHRPTLSHLDTAEWLIAWKAQQRVCYSCSMSDILFQQHPSPAEILLRVSDISSSLPLVKPLLPPNQVSCIFGMEGCRGSMPSPARQNTLLETRGG